MSFEIAVQSAVYSKLAADIPSIPVYDDVPQPESSGNALDFPYITIGEDIHTTNDTDTELINNVSITVHTWSRLAGRKQLKEIQGLIYDALHRANLTYSGYNFVNIAQINSESLLDSDGFTRHGVQTFNLIIEEL